MNVAQLKLDDYGPKIGPLGLFPRSNERGSIEALCSCTQVVVRFTGFHVRMNVAQLKQFVVHLLAAFHVTFPRSNERGSIEARQRPVKAEAPVAFPRSNERGSIEAGRLDLFLKC